MSVRFTEPRDGPVVAGLFQKEHWTEALAKPFALVARYPEHELAVHRLFATDPEFRSICEDYEETGAALDHWLSRGHENDIRAADYRRLLFDLEREILEYLDKHKA